MNIDPIFKEILLAMSANDIPCRVSADLRAKDQEETSAALDAPEFTYQEEDFRQIATKELAAPLERLFSTYSQIESIKGSFGDDAVNAKDALGWLMEDLAALDQEILTLWENA
jgi:hypothetical protein